MIQAVGIIAHKFTFEGKADGVRLTFRARAGVFKHSAFYQSDVGKHLSVKQIFPFPIRTHFAMLQADGPKEVGVYFRHITIVWSHELRLSGYFFSDNLYFLRYSRQ